MKRSLKRLLDFGVKAIDGEKGDVNDFLFDEEKWIIRYLKTDLETSKHGKSVLIGNVFLEKPDWDHFLFPVKLLKADIEKAPPLQEHLPVSSRYEEEYHKHYRIVNYWDLPASAMKVMYPPRPITVPTKDINEKDLNTNLRSYNEVANYHVHATDGVFGHVCDLIIDEDDWQIVYVIVDTSNWMPWSKKVMIPTASLAEISYAKKEIKINLTIDQIKQSPEYNEVIAVKPDYEQSLSDFYNSL